MKIFKRAFAFFLCFVIFVSLTSVIRPIYTVKSAPRKIKLLPILLDFSDSPHQRIASEVHDFFFGDKPEDRSLRNYYMDVANQTVEYVPGSYDVGDWIKMPKTKREYAKVQSVQPIATDVFEILANKNVNFDEYDQDGDGYLDYVLFVQAGDPDGWDIPWWPHKYSLFGKVSVGDKKIGTYNMISEIMYADKTAPAEVICHEFYHYQGGHDLYSYLYTRQYAVSNWDIMADDYNNFGMCGFSRVYLGWLRPTIITKSGVYEIDAIASKGPKRLYRVDIPGTKEYFLIENRQLVGVDAWWQGIPSTGLLFTHVDGAITPEHRFNDGPPDYPHFAVWVEDGGGVKQKKDAVYCADKNRTKFTMTTYPSTWDYEKKAKIGINFTQISKSDLKMTFRVDFVYQEPHPSVDVDMIDFGKIQKGINRAISIKINNEGTGTLSGKMFSKDNWISFDPDDFSGNGTEVKVIASADYVKPGDYKGKIEIKCKGGDTLTIPVKVQIVEFLGDINGDGKVDQIDYKIFLPCYGTKKGDEKYDIDCDLNSDDRIDITDLCILAKNMKK